MYKNDPVPLSIRNTFNPKLTLLSTTSTLRNILKFITFVQILRENKKLTTLPQAVNVAILTLKQSMPVKMQEKNLQQLKRLPTILLSNTKKNTSACLKAKRPVQTMELEAAPI
jgi:hypothetical protein